MGINSTKNNWEMTNALNDFDAFISLLNKGNRPAAFDLLRKINLPHCWAIL
jgi:hypothetical protein